MRSRSLSHVDVVGAEHVRAVLEVACTVCMFVCFVVLVVTLERADACALRPTLDVSAVGAASH